MPVTQVEIAAELGVSQYVVSHALRGSGRIAAETRQRVMEAARKLGYRPNLAAQVVSTGRFGSVALLLSNLGYGRSNLPATLFRGIDDALAIYDLHLTVARLPDQKLTSEGFVPKILRLWMADGLLVNYAEKIPQRMVTLIETHGLPAVWMNTKRSHDCVRPDDFGAARELTRRLLARGHRRIAYVDWSHGTQALATAHYSAADRLAGCQAAMNDAGLTLRLFQEPTSLELDERERAAMQFLAEPDRPTALIGYGENNVGPVAMAGVRLGLRLPDDLALATFGDTASSVGGFWIPTAIVPQREMGGAAVQLLLEKINDPSTRHECRTVPFNVPFAEESP